MQTSLVDVASPDEIAGAMRFVARERELRQGPHVDALWALYKAPNHALSRAELERRFQGLHPAFEDFCRRVAEHLGEADADSLALLDLEPAGEEGPLLRLKPAVAEAMNPMRLRAHAEA